jgi:D-beta-D-heptose 7-phosphate kinase/D-beta-D-heptose 1-phosphate adenosyltransferase
MSPPVASKNLIGYIAEFKRTRLAVIGDLMIDEFMWGHVDRISPEAPVPVVRITAESLMLGGAANVINNICALGGKVLVSGIIGNDMMGQKMIQTLKQKGVPTGGLCIEEGRPTSIKTRIVAQSQQVVRYDREDSTPIRASSREKIVDYLSKNIDRIDGVIISDYGKGVVSKPLMDRVRSIAQERGKILVVDPKIDHFSFYQGVTVITPNHHEASMAAGKEIHNDKDLQEVGRRLIKRCKCKHLLVTRGEEGMSLFDQDGHCHHIPTMAKEVFDVTGAGDTVISAFTLALAVGAKPIEAAVISNHAAGIVVGEVGTATVSGGLLKKSLQKRQL